MISFRGETQDREDADLLSLHELRAGETAVIERLIGGDEDTHRLEEFGFQRGAPIQMFRPGSPCIVRLRGQKLCLRPDQRVGILVRPCGGPCRCGRRRRRRFRGGRGAAE